MELELLWRKFELLRLRWRITTGRTPGDPEVLAAAVCYLDNQIAEIEAKQ